MLLQQQYHDVGFQYRILSKKQYQNVLIGFHSHNHNRKPNRQQRKYRIYPQTDLQNRGFCFLKK
ncbi:hypothetical protein D3C80_394400 [compost metagenome]